MRTDVLNGLRPVVVIAKFTDDRDADLLTAWRFVSDAEVDQEIEIDRQRETRLKEWLGTYPSPADRLTGPLVIRSLIERRRIMYHLKNLRKECFK